MTEADLLNLPDPRSEPSETLLAALESRRSAALTSLSEPGPGTEDLRRMLKIAARVPDHGALEPWRFIVFSGEARNRASESLARHYFAENSAKEPAQREKFAAIMARVFTHAPVVVVVVSCCDGKASIPAREQDLSAGAVCMNLLHAAHACRFDAVWLTGFPAYSPGARQIFGLAATENIAGIIHIGTAKEKAADRKRPDIDALTTFWQPAVND
jgi:nitroreductase